MGEVGKATLEEVAYRGRHMCERERGGCTATASVHGGLRVIDGEFDGSSIGSGLWYRRKGGGGCKGDPVTWGRQMGLVWGAGCFASMQR